ncbi:MAG: CBU_0592 family membrane protein [Thermomicrobiales bacterium]
MTVQLALVVEVLGAAMILAAFALHQFAGLDRHGYPYLLLNLTGAAILAVLAGKHQQWGFFLLQAVWAIVAAWGVFGLVRRGGAS